MAAQRTPSNVAGWSLIAAAIGFVAAFSYLAARFNYPEVLDGPADRVLPQLLQLGDAGRAVWVAYAFLPLLLIPASLGTQDALSAFAPRRSRAAMVAGVLAAITMILGLARWPSVHWALARAFVDAGPEGRVAIAAVFDGLNAYLGNYIGEFLGELALNAFFVLSGSALASAGQKLTGHLGMAAGAIGIVAAFRNVTPTVAPVSAIDNAILPLWLLALGIVFLRRRGT